MGAPSKIPLRFTQSSWLQFEWSLLPEHQQDYPAHQDWMCYCIDIKVTLGEGGWPAQPFHAWSGSLVADMFMDGLEQITEAVVLVQGETILFFGWWSHKEGLPLGNARDAGFSLTAPVNLARRMVQVEVTVNTIKEGCWAIADAVVEKRTKAKGPGCPHRMTKAAQAPATAYNIEEWMWGLEEEAPEVEARNSEVGNCGLEWRNTHSQHAGQGSRWLRQQGRPQFPADPSGGSSSSGGGSSDQGSDWRSQQSTIMRVCRESNQSLWAGRGLRVKVNLPIFKDEKTKYAVLLTTHDSGM